VRNLIPSIFVVIALLCLATSAPSVGREWAGGLIRPVHGTRAMNKSLFEGSRGDRTSMLIALLCFVHCVAGPVLLSVAGFASLIGISEKLEPLFLAGSAAMGVVALLPAYRKKHGRISCLALFAFGFLCLLLRHYIELRAIPVEPSSSSRRGSDHRGARQPQILTALPELRSLSRISSRGGSLVATAVGRGGY
jgi:hypothetical protein